VGGAEHAVLHLLYARFWHKVLYDRGYVTTVEPFHKLVNQGMILGENGEKMSKSRGNVINPDKVVDEYGADSLRLYEMFMGPLEATKPWSMEGVNGVRGFLDRVWRMITNERAETVELNPAVKPIEPTDEQRRIVHKLIRAVTEDIERLSFNTAIAKMMEFTNTFFKCDPRPVWAMKTLVLLLSPFAPHLAEELWELLGHSTSLAYETWPSFDMALTIDNTVEIPLQINGKVRSKLMVPREAPAAEIESQARMDERIAQLLDGKIIVKVIAVPGRLVNFVVK
jgi:leucyl-tRNA synthetase